MKINVEIENIKNEDIVMKTKQEVNGSIGNTWHWHIKDLKERPLIEKLDEYSSCENCGAEFYIKVQVTTLTGKETMELKVDYKDLRTIILKNEKANS